MKNGVFAGFYVLLTLFIVAGMIVPELITAQDFAGGDGSEGDPYQIETWEHLNNVRDYLDLHFVLNNDLTSETDGYETYASSSANGGLGWDPIGDYGPAPFQGVFDGSNFSISGLFINRPTEDFIGLFFGTDSAKLLNIRLSDTDIIGKNYVGALVGTASNTEVANISSSGTIQGTEYVGGIIGKLFGKITESNSAVFVRGIQLTSKYHG